MTAWPLKERGMALGIVVLSAVVFSVVAVAVLSLSVTSHQRATFHDHRLRARYAAEAGLVWAMQQLWNDPTWCGGTAPTVNGMAVSVTVENPADCGTTNDLSLKAVVDYAPI